MRLTAKTQVAPSLPLREAGAFFVFSASLVEALPELVEADVERPAETGGCAEAHDVRVARRPGARRPLPRPDAGD